MFFLKNNKLNPNEVKQKIESTEIDEIRTNYTVERIQKTQMLVVGKKLIKLLILGEIRKGRERQEGK